ncbi:MAG: putative MPP superfamily phosphohydrolase [Rhodothermales bacterium]|jgi:predicted MPP superfamily phosphohydrolase
MVLLAKLGFNIGFALAWIAAVFLVHRRKAHRSWSWPLIAGVLLCGAMMLMIPLFWSRRFVLMGLLSWGIFLHMPALALTVAVLCWREQRRLAVAASAVALALVSLWAYCFCFEAYNLKVRHYEIRSAKINSPMRIAVAADIQTDRPKEYDVRAMDRMMAEKPDLIVFAGDYIQTRNWSEYEAGTKALNAILRNTGIAAPLGAVAVRGNTDHEPLWRANFANLPIQILDGQRIELANGVTLDGLSMQDSFSREIALGASDAFHIVVGHCPNFALSDIAPDLMIAGHTHGGQVALPGIGPLIKGSVVPRSWAAGHTKISPDRHLVVSTGIGLERGHAPRLRFLCPPEIVIIDVLPQ